MYGGHVPTACVLLAVLEGVDAAGVNPLGWLVNGVLTAAQEGGVGVGNVATVLGLALGGVVIARQQAELSRARREIERLAAGSAASSEGEQSPSNASLITPHSPPSPHAHGARRASLLSMLSLRSSRPSSASGDVRSCDSSSDRLSSSSNSLDQPGAAAQTGSAAHNEVPRLSLPLPVEADDADDAMPGSPRTPARTPSSDAAVADEGSEARHLPTPSPLPARRFALEETMAAVRRLDTAAVRVQTAARCVLAQQEACARRGVVAVQRLAHGRPQREAAAVIQRACRGGVARRRLQRTQAVRAARSLRKATPRAVQVQQRDQRRQRHAALTIQAAVRRFLAQVRVEKAVTPLLTVDPLPAAAYSACVRDAAARCIQYAMRRRLSRRDAAARRIQTAVRSFLEVSLTARELTDTLHVRPLGAAYFQHVQHAAARRIQSAVRAFLDRVYMERALQATLTVTPLCPVRYPAHVQHAAASNIQEAARAFLTKAREDRGLDALLVIRGIDAARYAAGVRAAAAHRIQTAASEFLVRRRRTAELEATLTVRGVDVGRYAAWVADAAAQSIQACYRAHRARAVAAKVMQQAARVWLRRRAANAAAVRVQRAVRRFLEAGRQGRAGATIVNAGRRWLARRRAAARTRAAHVLQAHWRRRQTVRAAAVALQAAFRRWLARRHRAAVMMQRLGRSFATREIARRQQAAARVIQRMHRRPWTWARQVAAARVIQRCVRARAGRRMQHAACRIQLWYRSTKAAAAPFVAERGASKEREKDVDRTLSSLHTLDLSPISHHPNFICPSASDGSPNVSFFALNGSPLPSPEAAEPPRRVLVNKDVLLPVGDGDLAALGVVKGNGLCSPTPIPSFPVVRTKCTPPPSAGLSGLVRVLGAGALPQEETQPRCEHPAGSGTLFTPPPMHTEVCPAPPSSANDTTLTLNVSSANVTAAIVPSRGSVGRSSGSGWSLQNVEDLTALEGLADEKVTEVSSDTPSPELAPTVTVTAPSPCASSCGTEAAAPTAAFKLQHLAPSPPPSLRGSVAPPRRSTRSAALLDAMLSGSVDDVMQCFMTEHSADPRIARDSVTVEQECRALLESQQGDEADVASFDTDRTSWTDPQALLADADAGLMEMMGDDDGPSSPPHRTSASVGVVSGRSRSGSSMRSSVSRRDVLLDAMMSGDVDSVLGCLQRARESTGLRGRESTAPTSRPPLVPQLRNSVLRGLKDTRYRSWSWARETWRDGPPSAGSHDASAALPENAVGWRRAMSSEDYESESSARTLPQESDVGSLAGRTPERTPSPQQLRSPAKGSAALPPRTPSRGQGSSVGSSPAGSTPKAPPQYSSAAPPEYVKPGSTRFVRKVRTRTVTKKVVTRIPVPAEKWSPRVRSEEASLREAIEEAQAAAWIELLLTFGAVSATPRARLSTMSTDSPIVEEVAGMTGFRQGMLDVCNQLIVDVEAAPEVDFEMQWGEPEAEPAAAPRCSQGTTVTGGRCSVWSQHPDDMDLDALMAKLGGGGLGMAFSPPPQPEDEWTTEDTVAVDPLDPPSARVPAFRLSLGNPACTAEADGLVTPRDCGPTPTVVTPGCLSVGMRTPCSRRRPSTHLERALATGDVDDVLGCLEQCMDLPPRVRSRLSCRLSTPAPRGVSPESPAVVPGRMATFRQGMHALSPRLV